jgi:hypothetical protein
MWQCEVAFYKKVVFSWPVNKYNCLGSFRVHSFLLGDVHYCFGTMGPVGVLPSFVGTRYQCEVPFFSCPINNVTCNMVNYIKGQKCGGPSCSYVFYPDKYIQNNCFSQSLHIILTILNDTILSVFEK